MTTKAVVRISLWIVWALLMLFASSVLSAVAIPFGNSFCAFPNSAGEDFSGFVFMAIASAVTLAIGSAIVLVILRRAWRGNLETSLVLSRLVVALLSFPLLWLAFSLAYNYKTCPGFGRSITPEQMEPIRHG